MTTTWVSDEIRLQAHSLMANSIMRRLRRLIGRSSLATTFKGSQHYWEQRYRAGGTSGAGAYGRLAEFKAKVLNRFVAEHEVASVIEFGCGDGNQLSLGRYPKYVGLDVSARAVALCRDRFRSDTLKSFYLCDTFSFSQQFPNLSADLSLSLDVIYHLVEDDVFSAYMHNLFDVSTRYVIIYSSNFDERTDAPHVRHRQFSTHVDTNAKGWSLLTQIPNEYPYDNDGRRTSLSGFYVYEKY